MSEVSYLKVTTKRKTVRALGFRTELCSCGCKAKVLYVHIKHLQSGHIHKTTYHNFRKHYLSTPNAYSKVVRESAQ